MEITTSAGRANVTSGDEVLARQEPQGARHLERVVRESHLRLDAQALQRDCNGQGGPEGIGVGADVSHEQNTLRTSQVFGDLLEGGVHPLSLGATGFGLPGCAGGCSSGQRACTGPRATRRAPRCPR